MFFAVSLDNLLILLFTAASNYNHSVSTWRLKLTGLSRGMKNWYENQCMELFSNDSVEAHETQIMKLSKHDCGKDMGSRGTNYETVPMDGLSWHLSETWKITKCFISRHALRSCNLGVNMEVNSLSKNIGLGTGASFPLMQGRKKDMITHLNLKMCIWFQRNMDYC